MLNKTNKNLRCGNRKGLLSRNDQTHDGKKHVWKAYVIQPWDSAAASVVVC